jgi:hypothetical protein
VFWGCKGYCSHTFQPQKASVAGVAEVAGVAGLWLSGGPESRAGHRAGAGDGAADGRARVRGGIRVGAWMGTAGDGRRRAGAGIGARMLTRVLAGGELEAQDRDGHPFW